MTDDRQPWQRQPYETDAAFNAFHEFYLTQGHPRSVDEAYRQYKGYTKDKQKRAVLSFRRWSQGIKKDGSPIEGGMSWEERARAYDDYLAGLREAEFERQHMGAAEALARLANMARGSHADFADVHFRDQLKGHPNAHLVKTIMEDTYEDKAGRPHHKLRLELYPADAAIVKILKVHGKFAEAGDNDDKPFIVKVVYGDRNQGINNTSPPAASEASEGN